MASPQSTAGSASNASTSPQTISRSVSSTPPPITNPISAPYFNNSYLDASSRMRVQQPQQEQEFENVTSTFEKGCKSLKLGELVHSPYFGLLDAMAACEIMDPKMDSGYQNLTNLLSQYNINSDLSYNNVLAILDKLFCLQIEWFFGNPPLQTLFTSYYLHYQTPQLSYNSNASNLIFSYVHLIRLSGHFISNQVTEEGQFYEGEDFSNQLPHNVRWSQVPPYDEAKWVARSEELIMNIVDGLNIRDGILDQIIVRFKVQLLLLKICWGFYGNDKNIDELRGLLFESLELIRELDHGYEFSENTVDSAFNFNLSNLISGQVPPRPIEHWDFVKVKQNYKNFLKSALFITNVVQNPFGLTPSASQFCGLSLDKLLKSYSSSKNCTIVQVWLQSLLLNRTSNSSYFGKLSAQDFIPMYIDWFDLSDEGKEEWTGNDYLKPIWTGVNTLVNEGLVNFTKNVSRQRREGNKLVRKWQAQVNNIMQLIQSSNLRDYLSSEVLLVNLSNLIQNFLNYKKLEIMELILRLSFSLNLVNTRKDYFINLIYLEHVLRLNHDLILNYSSLSSYNPDEFTNLYNNLDKLTSIDFKKLRLYVISLELKLKLELVGCLILELELVNRSKPVQSYVNPDLPNYERITYRNRFRMFENLDEALPYDHYLRVLNNINQRSNGDLIGEIISKLELSESLIQRLRIIPAELKGLDYLLMVENDKELRRYSDEVDNKLKIWKFINEGASESSVEGLEFVKLDYFPYLNLRTKN